MRLKREQQRREQQRKNQGRSRIINKMDEYETNKWNCKYDSKWSLLFEN